MFFKKKLRQADKSIKQDNEFIVDSEGRALITVKATSEQKIFSEFDYDSGEKLNSDLVQYIWDKAEFVPINRDIKIKIYTGKTTKEKPVDNAIRGSFKKDYIALKAECRRNLWFSFAMLFIGLLFLGFLFLSYAFFKNDYVDAVIDIAAWVFLWEAVDSFFLRRSELNHKKRILLKLVTAKIEVVKLEKFTKRQ